MPTCPACGAEQQTGSLHSQRCGRLFASPQQATSGGLVVEDDERGDLPTVDSIVRELEMSRQPSDDFFSGAPRGDDTAQRSDVQPSAGTIDAASAGPLAAQWKSPLR